MKQGSAQRDGQAGQKREPISEKMSESAASQLGQSVQYVKAPLKEGRGFTAPKDDSRECHSSGSQGRH